MSIYHYRILLEDLDNKAVILDKTVTAAFLAFSEPVENLPPGAGGAISTAQYGFTPFELLGVLSWQIHIHRYMMLRDSLGQHYEPQS